MFQNLAAASVIDLTLSKNLCFCALHEPTYMSKNYRIHKNKNKRRRLCRKQYLKEVKNVPKYIETRKLII